MSVLDRTLFGIAIAAATTCGGIVYSSAINRLSVVEAHAEQVKAQRVIDAATLAEIRIDLRLLREDVAAVKQGLSNVRIIHPSTRTRFPESP